MAGSAQFYRAYLDFGPAVRGFEKTPDILAVVDDVMRRWEYTLANIVGTELSAHWLREGEKTGKLEDELDLIINIVGTPWFEIVLRDTAGASRYGGWLEGGLPIEITDDVVNGYRVLATTLDDGVRLRHEFVGEETGYEPRFEGAAAPLRAERRRVSRRAG